MAKKKSKLPYATKENKDELKRITKEIHKIHPGVVFYTMNSALNVAVALKETWKEAYPNEKLPLFYGVYARGKDAKKDIQKKVDILKRQIDINNVPIIVFDEYRGTEAGYGEKGAPEGFARRPIKFDNKLMNNAEPKHSNLAIATNNVHEAIEDNSEVYALGGHASNYVGSLMDKDYKMIDRVDSGDAFGYDRPTVRIRKGGKGASIIKALKNVGKEAGNELRDEQGRGLEKRVLGLMSLVGLGAGIFFLSPVLTGNVISANLNIINIAAPGLIVIGLIGLYLWYKK